VQKSSARSAGRGCSKMRWLGLVLLVWWVSASALSRDVALRDLRHTTWGPKEGAPGAITAMAQTSDGYLWLGNTQGLYRFDGLRFQQVELPVDDRLSSSNVFSLFAPASGGLWIGFTFGGVAFLQDGKWSVYTERDGLPPGSVNSMTQAQDGPLWLASTGGLARFDGSRWHTVSADEGRAKAGLRFLLADSTGTLWLVGKYEVTFLPKGENSIRNANMRPEGAEQRFSWIAESTNGTLWLGTEGGPVRKVRENRTVRGRAFTANLVLVDRDGALWTSAASGLIRVREAGDLDVPVGSNANLSSAETRPTREFAFGLVMEDREGNVWSTTATGLERFSERNVGTALQFPEGRGTAFRPIMAALAAADEGGIWVASETTVFNVRGAKAEPHEEVGSVSCAIRSERGNVTLAGEGGIWRLVGGRFVHTALPDGLQRVEVQAMAEDTSGALWVSIVRNGVFRMVDGAWVENGGVSSLPKMTAVALTTDAKGRVWFGYTGGRIAVLDGGQVTIFPPEGGPRLGNVSALHGRRGRVWAGGEFGLALFDGTRFRAVAAEAGIQLNNVTGIVETQDGDLWVNSSAGIVHVAPDETRRLAQDPEHRVRVEIFDNVDGVDGTSARVRPLPTAIEGTDGRLWFLRNTGVHTIDPSRLFRNPVPPPVVIQSVFAADKAYAVADKVVLPERTTSFRIDYVGLSLTLPEKVRYRYKLLGADRDWREAQASREAYFTDLSPGTYRFQVIAANNDGVWNDAGATVEIVIPPAFVQTAWFFALCIAGLAAVVWLLIRLRVRQVSARMRALHGERMAERERIARELHDTLLQSTQSLVLNFQSAANGLAPDHSSRGLLQRALDRADAVLAEGRDRVLDLRLPGAAGLSLPEAFAAVGDELLHGAGIQFRTNVDGQQRELVARVRDEAYRIGREALLNAFRHAQARSIEVQLAYSDQDFRVRVRDDGRGIDPTALESGSRAGHWGLSGIRERALELGAQIEIWSAVNAGTEIELIVPATVAYGDSTSRSRSRWRSYWPLSRAQR
jgi:signal transduction histidine kinase/ligand-binding sensor domain-containing protein